MTFKEIASKITGVSFPVFGVSWNPGKPDIKIAQEVINFLEDRRVPSGAGVSAALPCLT